MDHDVLGPDGGETIAAAITDALGEPRAVGWEQVVRRPGSDQLRNVGQAGDLLVFMDVDMGYVEARDHALAQVLGHTRVDREQNRPGAGA